MRKRRVILPSKPLTIYALYRGDTFIDVGTARELAARHNVKENTIRYMATAQYKRLHNYDRTVFSYRIEVDDEAHDY